VNGKFLRFVIKETTDGGEPGIDELEVYGTDAKVNLALKAKASASTCIAGYPIHQIPHLNDGKLGNNNSWISSERGGGWAQLEFPEAVEMRKIVWARDRTGICKDRLASAYRIEVSMDGQNWTKAGDEAGRGGAATGSRSLSGYKIEEIPTPFKGCRPSDITFTENGEMFAIAMTEGEVWRSRRPHPGSPETVQWTRFAAGLYHPIGIAVINNRVFVTQKPEVTELIDRTGDGVVDHYRTVATGWGLSTGWHEYTFGLGVDPQNNLWISLNTGFFWTHPGYVNAGRWRGSVLKISYGTEKIEEVAKGFRVPNGIAQGPDGNMFVTDNQGDWIQVCKLAHVQTGRFYGHPETKEVALPEGKYPDGHSAVWMPYGRSKSTSGPVCDKTGGKFGPFDGQLFVGDVGYGANTGVMRVALEKVDGDYQGAIFPFLNNWPLGCERLKFGPDNALYACSLTTGLTRLTFNGKAPMAMHSMNIRPGGAGFTIKFTKPLAPDCNPAPANINVKRYHYLYTGNYGSPQAEEAVVPVEKAELSADRTSLTLSLPVQTYPIGMVYEFSVNGITAADGDKLDNPEAWYTVYTIPKAP
jgi:glucose/arabinose dehydrogenase